jgi:hypothetical protein
MRAPSFVPASAAQAKEIASKLCDAARRARPFPRTWGRPEAPTRAIPPSLTMRKPVQSVQMVVNPTQCLLQTARSAFGKLAREGGSGALRHPLLSALPRGLPSCRGEAAPLCQKIDRRALS